MYIADVAARIIVLVEGYEGNPENLLDLVIEEVDDWGQQNYDQALDDYGVVQFEKEDYVD